METLILEKKENYLIVQLNRGRSNPINGKMVEELRQLIRDVEKDDSILGMIFTGQRNFFCVGLDVLELYHYDAPAMAKFWTDFTDMVHELTAFSKPLISAITGHSPAGGCLLAICCDYRVMINEPRFRIGLNEVPVGIVVPNGILALYGFWLGKGKAYQMLMQGHLFEPQDALQVGLVDEIVEREKVLEQAEKKMKFYLSFPYKVWRNTKQNLRIQLLEESVITEKEKEDTLEKWWDPVSRKALEKVVNRLNPKK